MEGRSRAAPPSRLVRIVVVGCVAFTAGIAATLCLRTTADGTDTDTAQLLHAVVSSTHRRVKRYRSSNHNYKRHEEKPVKQKATTPKKKDSTLSGGLTQPEFTSDDREEFLLQQLSQRLRPRDLLLERDEQGVKKRQFVHLHHMKTGGTSINQLMSCALKRARTLLLSEVGAGQTIGGGGGRRDHSAKGNDVIPYASLSECAYGKFQNCMSGQDKKCKDKIDSSAVMEYCSPLFAVNKFGWLNADMVTVIRSPVDRVWSMFRFRTKSCYKCIPLLEVYDLIDAGKTDDVCGTCQSVCIPQLSNHQTRNLLTSDPIQSNMTDQEQIDEALYNLRNRFTVVGVTSELATTAEMLGHVFPWLAEELPDVRRGRGGEEPSKAASTTPTCALKHANASPKNNHCGEKNGHWDLPDEPDEETREAILRHNKLDMMLHKAALEHFELQKKALGWS